MIRCAIYPRKSKQVDNSDSMQTQVDMCLQYLDAKYGKGKYSVAIYDGDYGITGHSIKNRKDFQRMMNDVKAGNVDLVVIQRYDRIARNTRDFCNIFYEMEKNNCNLVSVSQQIDTSTPYGKKFMYDQASMAELEWALCSERRKDANRYARSIGKCTLSDHCITFGYKAEVVDGIRRMVIDEEKKDVVYDIFDYIKKYRNNTGCSKYILEKYGISISHTTIRNMIKRTFYYGFYDGNENFCEPYITKKEWEELQYDVPVIRNDPKKKTEILFSGLIKCPVCHRKMRSAQKSKNNGNVYRYYHCEFHTIRRCEYNKVRSEIIIEELLIKFLTNYIENIDAVITEQDRKSQNLKDNTKVLEQELERLNSMYLKGRISELFYDTEYLRITHLIDLNKAQTQAEGHIEKIQDIFVSNWVDVYNQLDKLHRKLFWRQVLQEIVIDKDGNVIDVIFL